MGRAVANNATGRVDFGSNAAFKITGDVSFAAWVRFGSTSPTASLIACSEVSSLETEATNSVLFVELEGSSNAWDITYIHEYSTGINETNRFDTNIADSTWTHIALCRNTTNKTVKLYLNGTLHSTFNYTNNPTNTGSACSFTLFQRPDGTLSIDTCVMAEVMLATREWSADEAYQIYNGQVLYTSLLVYARLGVASPEPDWSGNGFVGTLSGTTGADIHPPIGSVFGYDRGAAYIVPVVGIKKKTSFYVMG